METHSDTDWELSIGWYSILFYHKEIEFYAQTLIIPFDMQQHATYMHSITLHCKTKLEMMNSY